MNFYHNVSLKGYNTFGIDEIAEQYIVINALNDLRQISNLPGEKRVIGMGSNILCTQPIRCLLIANKLKGVEKSQEDENYVWFQVASGEIWHEFVQDTLKMGLSGHENLSLIPGTVGAAPIQNIGAYGAEFKNIVQSVTFWHWGDKMFKTLSNDQCKFGYRDSIFKQNIKGQFFITSVSIRLNKNFIANTSYGSIQEELLKANISNPTAKDISNCVIQIRRSKLPNPDEIGNAGSFFKNPSLLVSEFKAIQEKNPNIPFYNTSDETVKIPAAWLIEQCGWKGFRKDDYGVHEKQALVLVNYGDAQGEDILALSNEIISSVQQSFGILLETEVQIW